jgi:hypothetical protein
MTGLQGRGIKTRLIDTALYGIDAVHGHSNVLELSFSPII